MRFIGKKAKLLDNIFEAIPLKNQRGGSFCDFFSGTTTVGRYFKKKGFKVMSSDILFFSYVLQRAYIANNSEPNFAKLMPQIVKQGKNIARPPLESVIQHLSSLEGQEGFIYHNYTAEGTDGGKYVRKYFSGANGKKIDAIRLKIDEWRTNKLISEVEFFILLAALIESVPFYSNISGVYAAFLKKYDPRALKPFEIRPMRLCLGEEALTVHNANSMDLIDEIDVNILYLDPPYNGRQYAPNYHLLETIALYDSPKIKGVTGMRDYTEKKSEFCNPRTGIAALEKIAAIAKYECLVLSYNSEGIMSADDIFAVLSEHGNVKITNINYPRFKSNNNGKAKGEKIIQEQLYILQP